MYFLHLFHAGGFMMYPLLLCSIIVVAIFFERYRYYSSHRSDTERLSAVMTDSLNRGDIEGLKDALKADGGIPAGAQTTCCGSGGMCWISLSMPAGTFACRRR